MFIMSWFLLYFYTNFAMPLKVSSTTILRFNHILTLLVAKGFPVKLKCDGHFLILRSLQASNDHRDLEFSERCVNINVFHQLLQEHKGKRRAYCWHFTCSQVSQQLPTIFCGSPDYKIPTSMLAEVFPNHGNKLGNTACCILSLKRSNMSKHKEELC